jgi:multiple sugar transport system permease protein
MKSEKRQTENAGTGRLRGVRLSRIAAYAVLLIGTVVVLIPFVWLLSTSLKDPANIFLDPPQWIPKPVRWDNYIKAFSVMPFPLYLWNTCRITFSSLALQLFSCSIVAFGFARMRFPGRKVLFIVLLSTLMLPAQVTMIPVFKIWSSLGLYDTFVPLILPSAFGSAFFIFLLRQYLMGIPKEMDEAARIDGAGTLQVWWKVILPQAKPALAAVAVLSFMANWNDFMGPLIYLSDPSKRTLALALWAFQGQYSTDWHLLMAASTVVMLPLLVLFFAAQKYFIQGVVISGVKG